jgi:hypothetical protein
MLASGTEAEAADAEGRPARLAGLPCPFPQAVARMLQAARRTPGFARIERPHGS